MPPSEEEVFYTPGKNSSYIDKHLGEIIISR